MKKEYRKDNKILRVMPFNDEWQIILDNGRSIKYFTTPLQKSYLLQFLLLHWLGLSNREVFTIMGVVR